MIKEKRQILRIETDKRALKFLKKKDTTILEKILLSLEKFSTEILKNAEKKEKYFRRIVWVLKDKEKEIAS